MDFLNHTPFPALPFQGLTPAGEAFHVVVLRQTCSFEEGTLAIAAEQSPLCVEDTFAAGMNRSSVLAESDLCTFKPKCDLILDATAHAPGKLPRRSFPARLRLWDPEAPGTPLVDKTLQILGPSQFRRRSGLVRCFWWLVKVGTLGLVSRNPWKRTRPEAIRSLPVRYEYAYGGEASVLASDRCASRVKRKNWLPGVSYKTLKAGGKASERAPLAWEVHEANPVGTGFLPLWWLRASRTRVIRAPQVEAPAAPMTARHFLRLLTGKAPGAAVPPGFGILGKGWTPRRHLAGRVDEAWIKSGRPFPEGFAFSIWNGAPPDQQLPFLKGSEVLELTNLCALDHPGARLDAEGNTLLRIELPGHRPYLLAGCAEGERVVVPMHLDTVAIDAGASVVGLVWRTVLPLEPRVRALEARMVEKSDLKAWLDRGGPELCPPSASHAARLEGLTRNPPLPSPDVPPQERGSPATRSHPPRG